MIAMTPRPATGRLPRKGWRVWDGWPRPTVPERHGTERRCNAGTSSAQEVTMAGAAPNPRSSLRFLLCRAVLFAALALATLPFATAQTYA